MGWWKHGVNTASTKDQVLPSDFNSCAHAYKYMFVIMIWDN